MLSVLLIFLLSSRSLLCARPRRGAKGRSFGFAPCSHTTKIPELAASSGDTSSRPGRQFDFFSAMVDDSMHSKGRDHLAGTAGRRALFKGGSAGLHPGQGRLLVQFLRPGTLIHAPIIEPNQILGRCCPSDVIKHPRQQSVHNYRSTL
ncbi:hypothetical protein QBC33DRAFT_354581 [Phialemonium atrogriseum]|uniref:Secreted protein n=1 Tax=Phialemonium atrogriseum TaxID=1093897 RepID=A0AAJ0C3Y8_9PEZI|nr:uncharacterized protein QBC33DRAFT_354581 [Phialemonium atrogriseum]KAK1768663.1 hypothetical protein QBC33DRAFT_354581 [Phialemonium atrogriseum]